VTRLVVTVDPDSRSSAIAWGVREGDGFVIAGAKGGGSRCVSWQTVTGARAWLAERCAEFGFASADVVVVVELQAASGPQSKDCEALRRVRYHWEAACEIDGYAYESVSARTWQTSFVPLADRPPPRSGEGAWKRAYRARARAISSAATNEDRAAAIGMLWWFVVDVLGSRLASEKDLRGDP
jgi:hypothetical protein